MDYSETRRNSAINDLLDATDAGTGAGKLQLATDNTFTTILSTHTLQDPAWSVASAGSKTLQGLPLSTTYSATGTATHGRFVDSDDTLVAMGTVGVSGSGADIIVTNTSAATGISVEITSASFSFPSTGVIP